MSWEHRKSRSLQLWIVTGVFFMVLPGTILGFTNLLFISAHHGLSGLSAAWIQAHGHSQVFGWIGSFVLAIGFYSQPRTHANEGSLPTVCWALWTLGLLLHWIAGAYQWQWRITLPFSGVMELVAISLFLYAARQHKLPDPACIQASQTEAKQRIEPWMQSVLMSNVGLFLAVGANMIAGIRLAIQGTGPALPHEFDQRYLVLLGWGFLAPLIWGFAAHWVPTFLGARPVHGRLLRIALLLDLFGVVSGVARQTTAASLLLAFAAVLATLAIRVLCRSERPAKVAGIHSSFPFFLRLAFIWSIVAALMGIWAAFADLHGGIWGASRHALTVGYAAMMVMTVGPRILPHFAGVRGIRSTNLMFATLLLLTVGCTLRVSMEPLAYEGMWQFAWKILPASGCLELAAVLLFATQLVLTFTLEPSIFTDRRGAIPASA